MTREELLELRQKLLRGSPPFTPDPTNPGNMTRKIGVPGLEERRAMGDFDANASGVRMALEACLALVQNEIDKKRKP